MPIIPAIGVGLGSIVGGAGAVVGSVGTALGATTAAGALGLGTAALGTAAVGANVISKAMKSPDINMPSAPTVTSPKVADEISKAVPTTQTELEKIKEEEKKKLAQGRTKRSTLLTGPLGLLTSAPTEKKTLLGA